MYFRFSFIFLTFAMSFFRFSLHAAGFRVMLYDGVEIGVWYPSDADTVSQRLGPFEVDIARDAPIQKGTHQIILFSHGHTGRYRNHYQTAQILADAGFVVAAPQHKADYLIRGRKTARALNHRYLELEAALRAVLAEPDFQVDRDTIHGIGYSLGGATILLAAGAEFSTERLQQYCQLNKATDTEYCEDTTGWFSRFLQSFRNRLSLPKTTATFNNKPFVNGRMVLVAPAFQGFGVKDALSGTSLTVFAIQGDTIAKPEFQARPLVRALSPYVKTDLQTVSGHHYAFIAPFPQWLIEEENIPPMLDPEGFDRQAFLTDINARILSVFNR